MSEQGKDKKSKPQQQREDVDFLHENFDLQTPKAAGLVTDDGDEADRLSREANERQLHKDELKDVPVPEEPERDLIEDADETRLKPLIRSRKK
jgi:hypothetical protein